MSGLFITGTDTGVGKTVVCGLLGRYLLERGYNVVTQKWIQTGAASGHSDINLHLRLMKRRRKDIQGYLPYVIPCTYRFASAPHLAAELERQKVSPKRIKTCYKFLSKQFDIVLVEGAGGALVPFSRKNLIVDIVRQLNLPVLIVVANRLGAINHTLLTIEALSRRRLKTIGIIFNNRFAGISRRVLDDNTRIIKRLSRAAILGTIPRIKDSDALYTVFAPLGDKILNCLKGDERWMTGLNEI